MGGHEADRDRLAEVELNNNAQQLALKVAQRAVVAFGCDERAARLFGDLIARHVVTNPDVVLRALGGWEALVTALGGSHYATALGFEAVFDAGEK